MFQTIGNGFHKMLMGFCGFCVGAHRLFDDEGSKVARCPECGARTFFFGGTRYCTRNTRHVLYAPLSGAR